MELTSYEVVEGLVDIANKLAIESMMSQKDAYVLEEAKKAVQILAEQKDEKET